MSESRDGLEQGRCTPDRPVSALSSEEWRERWREKGARRDARAVRNLMRALAAIALTLGAVWAAVSLL